MIDRLMGSLLVVGLLAAPARADEGALLSALSALKDHVTGVAPLDAAQIEAHKLTIDANAGIFGDTAASIAASFDYVQAYDQNVGPLWKTGSPASGGFNRNNLTNDIHWTTYNVMQNIMDDTFNSGNIAAHANLLDGFKFGSADVFPGPASPPNNPNKTYTVSVDGSFLQTFGRDTQQWTLPARKATGAYLAPGSIATVTVPQALVGQGYQLRVGGQSWDMANRPPVDRLERSSLVYDINSTQVQVASPLGGNLYVEVPYLADAGVVSIGIQNAIRSPLFSMQDHNTTTLADWQNTERNYAAPWADFQTEKFMMHVPTTWVYNLDDPVTLMQDWDKAMDVMNDLMGFPRIRGKETMFPQVDVRFRSSVYAPGYPSVNVTYDPERDYGGTSNHHLITGPQNAADYEFHEQGHAYFFPKLPGETESAVNLLHVAVMNQAFGVDLDTAFAGSRGFAGNPNRTLDNTAVAWMTSFNFAPRRVPMASAEKAYQLKGHAKFVEIARLFGWDKLGDYYRSMNQDEVNGDPLPSGVDGHMLRLSEKVGEDIRPLFHFWGIHPDDPAALDAAIDAANLPQSQAILDLLEHYKTLVPTDNAAFQAFALGWWGHEPNPNGYWTESEHARQWDTTPWWQINGKTEQRPNGEIYDQAAAAEIRLVIDDLIDLYFPIPFLNEALADLNFDKTVDGLDWVLFRAGMQADLSSLSEADAYLMGDLDGDFDNDIYDFDLFRKAYEQYNPAPGAFAEMVAEYAVPEPASAALLVVGTLALGRRRRASGPRRARRAAHRAARRAAPVVLLAVVLGFTASAGAVVVFNEDFENPDVAGYAEGSTPPGWVRATQGFGGSRHGLVDKASGDFAAADPNQQAYAFRYTNSGLTTAAGVIGDLGFGQTFTVSFDAVRDDGLNAGTPYTAQLVAFAPGVARDDVRSTPLGSVVLGQASGNAPADGTFASISFSYTQGDTADDGYLGYDLGVRFKGATTSAIIDNVQVDRADPPPSAFLTLRVNTTSGAASLVGGSVAAVNAVNYYQVASAGNSLEATGWRSLADQDFEGNGPPTGAGNGWEEAGGAGPHALAEAYLLGDSAFADGVAVGIGAAYDESVDARDLALTYRTAAGLIFPGNVEYFSPLAGDADNDGDVDNADLGVVAGSFTGSGGSTSMTWADGDMDGDGDVDNADLGVVAGSFTGSQAGGAVAVADIAAVPEPASAVLLVVAGLMIVRRR